MTEAELYEQTPSYIDNDTFSTTTERKKPDLSTDILNIRLDTSNFLDRIRNMLACTEEIEVTDIINGVPTTRIESRKKAHYEPLMNAKGIERVMSFLEGYINSQTVQGNKSREQLDHMMYYLSNQLIIFLVCNRREIELKKSNISLLHKQICDSIDLFLSRTQDDGERRSYSDSMTSSEVRSREPAKKNKFFDWFNY